MKTSKIFDTPLFGLGFRVFFALAGCSALALIVIWNALFKGNLIVHNYFTANYWHAHEMLLGYSVAVIAGFLLTAVKNWTGKPTLTGDKLAGLCLLWIYGRLMPFYESLLPDIFIASVDIAFLPILTFQIAKPIIAAKQYKQLIFVAILSVLTLGNVLIHADILGFMQYSADLGIKIIIATLIILILVISGRVFPFFTERGLSNVLIVKSPLYDKLSIGSAALVFALQLMNISGFLLVLAAVLAAIFNAARVINWYSPKVRYVPLLWVLYTGYSWIILGFLLTAISAYSLIPASIANHAFTLGGIGVLTLGMMSRVSLGHTGRALKATNTIATAFVLLNIAALFRVLLPIAFPGWYENLIYITTLLWLAAFSLFILVYAPILTTARIDGQEG